MQIRTLMLTTVCCLAMSVGLPAADVVLNEYNAVRTGNLLDDGNGRDAYFGTIFGNGGNWFELLVIEDHVDMRGWNLNWTEDEEVNGGQTAAGTLTLSDAMLWSDLRAGTLITFIETINGGGEDGVNTGTDVSYDPANDDWWINIATREEQGKGAAALVTTTTNDGDPGDFSTGSSDWTLTILDAGGTSVFGPVGEGAGWAGGGVNNSEGGSLEGPMTDDGTAVTLEMWRAITPASDFYDDTGSTSFGMPNQDYDGMTQLFTPLQDLSALRSPAPPLGNGDFDNDGQLTAADIDLLSQHILAGGNDLQYDVNQDQEVNQEDREAWVVGLKRTYFGDANLDGEFGSADLVVVLGAGEYEDDLVGNSGWATGDWNGDAEFTTSDLVTALSGGGYELGPRAAVAAVPEPHAVWLLSLGLLTAFGVRRSH